MRIRDQATPVRHPPNSLPFPIMCHNFEGDSTQQRGKEGGGKARPEAPEGGGTGVSSEVSVCTWQGYNTSVSERKNPLQGEGTFYGVTFWSMMARGGEGLLRNAWCSCGTKRVVFSSACVRLSPPSLRNDRNQPYLLCRPLGPFPGSWRNRRGLFGGLDTLSELVHLSAERILLCMIS